MLAYSGQIIEGQMGDALWKRAKALRVLGLPAYANREQRAPMERIVEGNDFMLVTCQYALSRASLRMVVARIFAGELQCGFVGFCSRVGKKYPLGESQFAQPKCQPDGGLVRQHVGDVPELVGLFGQRVDGGRMRMAERADGDAPGEIHILFARLIPDTRANAAHRNVATRRIARHHHLVEGGAGDSWMLWCH